MPLRVISIVSFGFGVIFGEIAKRGEKLEIWTRNEVPTPQREEPM